MESPGKESGRISPSVDLTPLDCTDGAVCISTPTSTPNSKSSSRSPKSPIQSPCRAYAAEVESGGTAAQRRELLLAGAEDLFTVNGDSSYMKDRAAADFRDAWTEFRGDELPSRWAECDSCCQFGFVCWLLDNLERANQPRVDPGAWVSSLLHLVVSGDPEAASSSWPPSPSLEYARLIFSAGGFPCVLQQLRRLLVELSKLNMRMSESPAAAAEREQMWSSIYPWLALVWCLMVSDKSHRGLCTREEMVDLVVLLLSALAAPSGCGETASDKPAGLVILLYQSLVRSVGEAALMSCTPPGLSVPLKPSSQAERDFTAQLCRKFPHLASRAVQDLPTPLREAYQVLAETRAKNSTLDVVAELFAGREASQEASLRCDSSGQATLDCVIQSAELLLPSGIPNVGSMITALLEREQGTQPGLAAARGDVLVDAAARSLTVLIKSCQAPEANRLCELVVDHHLIQPMLRFLCARIGAHAWDVDLETNLDNSYDDEHSTDSPTSPKAPPVLWDPTPRSFQKVVSTSQQRRAIAATTRLIWVVTKRCHKTVPRLIELKGPTIFRKLVDSCSGNTRVCALRILKAMMPHVGKRWRQNNMKLVSAIYESVRPHVSEAWLVTTRQPAFGGSEPERGGDREDAVVVSWEHWCEDPVARVIREAGQSSASCSASECSEDEDPSF